MYILRSRYGVIRDGELKSARAIPPCLLSSVLNNGSVALHWLLWLMAKLAKSCLGKEEACLGRGNDRQKETGTCVRKKKKTKTAEYA